MPTIEYLRYLKPFPHLGLGPNMWLGTPFCLMSFSDDDYPMPSPHSRPTSKQAADAPAVLGLTLGLLLLQWPNLNHISITHHTMKEDLMLRLHHKKANHLKGQVCLLSNPLGLSTSSPTRMTWMDSKTEFKRTIIHWIKELKGFKEDRIHDPTHLNKTAITVWVVSQKTQISEWGKRKNEVGIWKLNS